MINDIIQNIKTEILCKNAMGIEEATMIPVEMGGMMMPVIPVVPSIELGRRLLKYARQGNTKQVHDLMTKGAPFQTDWLGTSALHLAAMNNHVNTCEVLLRAGISKDSRTKVERTPLHLAVYEGHLDIVKLLIKNGAEVDCRDMLRMTPLHWAVEKGFNEITELLIREGADPTAVNKFEKTPLSIAVEKNNLAVAQLLQLASRVHTTKNQQLQEEEDAMNQEESAYAGSELALELQPEVQITETSMDANPKMDSNSRESDNVAANISQTDANMAQNETNAEMSNELAESLIEQVDENGKEIQEEQDTNVSDIKPNISAINGLKIPNLPNSVSATQLSTLQMLQEHGIQMLPTDDGGLISNAIQSGRTVVLSEAGKLVLAESKKMPPLQPTSDATPPPLARKKVIIPVNLKNKKIITLTADQFLAMTQNQKQPNILKKVSAEDFKRAAQTAGVKYTTVPPLKLTKPPTTYSSPKVKRLSQSSSPPATNNQSTQSSMEDLSSSPSSQTDIAEMQAKLNEALKLVELYKKQLEEKENENMKLNAQIASLQSDKQELHTATI